MKIPDTLFLECPTAERLYHEYAEGQPILDYHCHLPPDQIANDHRFRDLAEIWLEGDHYKWRALRANGVPEEKITGSAGPREKFDAWVETVPYTLRNPLYVWSHLELKRYFGIDVTISPGTGAEIWDEANRQVESLTVHEILRRNRVAALCTTDDPADSLEHHERIASSGLATKVYPAFRPDKALAVDKPDMFRGWVEKLGNTMGRGIGSFFALKEALLQRHRDFHAIGCRLSDHGLEHAYAEPCTEQKAESIFVETMGGAPAPPEEKAGWAALFMLEFGRWDAANGWTKQLHLGPLRNLSTRAFRELGPDTGYDTIGDFDQIQPLARYLDRLDSENSLPRMILYNVNPVHNYAFAAMAGSFQRDVPGKVQFGSGWWFLDQKEGIEWQLNALSNIGLLRRFVGMLTDSRSFLSYTRHEYFRRVLCNLLGKEMERGELPDDIELIGKMVREICFENARAYFRLPGV